MIYFNNAATSWPKFPSTVRRMREALEKGQVYCGRDTADFMDTEKTVFSLRENLGKILHASEPHEICLASSSTLALDEIILGRAAWLRENGMPCDGFVLCSDREHNSVMRPLQHLKDAYGIPFACVPTPDGVLSEDALDAVIEDMRKNGRAPVLAVFSQVSNVTGDVLNAGDAGRFFEARSIPFVLDATQGIGIVPVDVESMKCAAVAFAGHKGLNGPQGTGGFYIRKGFEINPILFGGTGHASSRIDPPVEFPDSFEVGTPPVHDVIGFADAVEQVVSMNGAYSRKILDVSGYCRDKVAKISGYRVLGNGRQESPVFSFVPEQGSPGAVAEHLWRTAGINCRAGLLCSPMGVHACGADSVVRFSFGFYNTKGEADIAASALEDFASRL